MSERKSEIMKWLKGIRGNPHIGIDEGGLTIRTEDGTAWYEIGGIDEKIEAANPLVFPEAERRRR